MYYNVDNVDNVDNYVLLLELSGHCDSSCSEVPLSNIVILCVNRRAN